MMTRRLEETILQSDLTRLLYVDIPILHGYSKGYTKSGRVQLSRHCPKSNRLRDSTKVSSRKEDFNWKLSSAE